MKRPYLCFLFLLIISLSFISCEYKDLCYEHPHRMKVKVEFDWQKISIAMPRWMEVWLFPLDGGKALHFQISDYENGYIHVVPGKYRALCYNGDTNAIYEDGIDDFYSFTLTAKDIQPERMVCASISLVDVRLSYEDQTLRFAPEDGVMDVTVTIHDVRNLKSTNGLKVLFSGMASGFCVAMSQCTEESQTLYSEMEKEDSTTLQSRFVSFGHCSVMEVEHIFSVVASTDDGSLNAYHWNVTERVHAKEQDPHHVRIDLYGLELPKDLGSDNGMSPYVDGWQNVWIKI